jgi:hypothetical protein
MPYTNVDIFRGEGANIFSKKVWEPLNFRKKMGQKKLYSEFQKYPNYQSSDNLSH